MNITVPPELAKRLLAEAERRGLTPDQYASQVVGDYLARIEQARQGESASLDQSDVAGVDRPNQASIDAQWAAEAEKRVQDIIANQVQTIPAEKVFHELRGRHSQQ